MRVIVDTWSGNQLGGEIIYDTVAHAIERRITWDYDGGSFDRGSSGLPYATPAQLYAYRITANIIQVGDTVQVVTGRKMRGKIDVVDDMYAYIIPGTYGRGIVEYIKFSDTTTVQKRHCQLLSK